MGQVLQTVRLLYEADRAARRHQKPEDGLREAQEARLWLLDAHP